MFNAKKIKRLNDENEDLKLKIETFNGKEENIKNLNIVLKKMRLEVAGLNEEKRTLQESIEQIKQQEEGKKNEIAELGKKIDHLREMKDELQNVVLSYTNRIENIENTIKWNQDSAAGTDKTTEEIEDIEKNNSELIKKQSEIEQSLNDARERTNNLNEEESGLLERKQKLAAEIDQMQGRLKELLSNYDEINTKIRVGNERINFLKAEEIRIKNELSKKQREISEVEKNLQKLKDEERALLNSVREMDSILAEKKGLKNSLEEEHSSLMNDLNEKRNLLLQTQEEFDRVSREIKIQNKDLFDTEQTLSIKAQKLSNINIELMTYEKRYNALKSEVIELEKARNDLRLKLQADNEVYEKSVEQNKKLTELVPLLEKRKEEIEQGNLELEERFTIMFQKFNHELNQINRKRSVLEQIVLKKEKDVDEKDQLLFEKIAALEESERILNMRKVEIESFEDQITGLKEQKHVLRTDLNKVEEETTERKNYFTDVRLETELLMNKKIAIEKNLQEMLTFMNESFGKSKERNLKFEKELVYYEEQLNDYRSKIADSLKELDEVKVSIGSLRIEREEYKGNVQKLNTLKKKLQEEILKHQVILQRYQKMREKLKLEQATGKTFDEIPPKGKGSQSKEMKNTHIYKL